MPRSPGIQLTDEEQARNSTLERWSFDLRRAVDEYKSGPYFGNDDLTEYKLRSFYNQCLLLMSQCCAAKAVKAYQPASQIEIELRIELDKY